tara:strand:- start:1980 stop:2432 length:453 start_codon:yes stop_codon:yes gene_type:complete
MKDTDIKVGVVGYSAQEFDVQHAQACIEDAFDKVEAIYSFRVKNFDHRIICISGLIDIGIPALAYREAVKRGWQTAGVACSLAEDYECFDVDEKFIVGDQWGEESDTFLGMIGVMIKIGGGKQSDDEMRKHKENGLPVFEYVLEADQPDA